MKKLIVLLLAFAMVGAVSAQVATKVSLSGSVYLENFSNTATAPVSSLSPNGATYDVLTISGADKDGKYGFALQDRDLIKTANLNIDRWYAWGKVGKAKITLGGSMGGGDYVQYVNNGWIENYDPSDGFAGTGIQFDYSVSDALKVGAFLPLSGATAVNTFEAAKIGAAYSVGKTNLYGQVNLDIANDNNLVNVGFDFTGVANLDVYGFGEYQIDAATTVFALGGQYKTATYRVGAEIEGTADSSNFAWDVVANLRYYVTKDLFVQVRPDYQVYQALSTKVNYPDGRFRVRGYVNYALGSGLAVEGMVGYDTAKDTYVALPAAAASDIPVNGIIHYIRLTYSVSL